tara:strand:- start:1534 stop:1785 length:252 start_codon:yes stop_codon:yes gene_type:complete
MKLRPNERLIDNIDVLREIKQQDLVSKRLTYIVPIRSHGDYIKDELMWVEDFKDTSAIVFRCMDGKRHSFNEEQIKQFKLTAR